MELSMKALEVLLMFGKHTLAESCTAQLYQLFGVTQHRAVEACLVSELVKRNDCSLEQLIDMSRKKFLLETVAELLAKTIATHPSVTAEILLQQFEHDVHGRRYYLPEIGKRPDCSVEQLMDLYQRCDHGYSAADREIIVQLLASRPDCSASQLGTLLLREHDKSVCRMLLEGIHRKFDHDLSPQHLLAIIEREQWLYSPTGLIGVIKEPLRAYFASSTTNALLRFLGQYEPYELPRTLLLEELGKPSRLEELRQLSLS